MVVLQGTLINYNANLQHADRAVSEGSKDLPFFVMSHADNRVVHLNGPQLFPGTKQNGRSITIVKYELMCLFYPNSF